MKASQASSSPLEAAKMQTALRSCALVSLFVVALACAGQNAPQHAGSGSIAQPTGSLSGTVYCADTNQAARLAEIYLFHISGKAFGSQSRGQTDLEGRFSLHHVEEGDYYVVAVLPGYVNLLGSLTKAHLDAMTDEDRKNLLAQ